MGKIFGPLILSCVLAISWSACKKKPHPRPSNDEASFYAVGHPKDLSHFIRIDVEDIDASNYSLDYYEMNGDVFPRLFFPGALFDSIEIFACFGKTECGEGDRYYSQTYFSNNAILPLSIPGTWYLRFRPCLASNRSQSGLNECKKTVPAVQAVIVTKLPDPTTVQTIQLALATRVAYNWLAQYVYARLYSAYNAAITCTDNDSDSMNQLTNAIALGPNAIMDVLWTTTAGSKAQLLLASTAYPPTIYEYLRNPTLISSSKLATAIMENAKNSIKLGGSSDSKPATKTPVKPREFKKTEQIIVSEWTDETKSEFLKGKYDEYKTSPAGKGAGMGAALDFIKWKMIFGTSILDQAIIDSSKPAAPMNAEEWTDKKKDEFFEKKYAEYQASPAGKGAGMGAALNFMKWKMIFGTSALDQAMNIGQQTQDAPVLKTTPIEAPPPPRPSSDSTASTSLESTESESSEKNLIKEIAARQLVSIGRSIDLLRDGFPADIKEAKKLGPEGFATAMSDHFVLIEELSSQIRGNPLIPPDSPLKTALDGVLNAANRFNKVSEGVQVLRDLPKDPSSSDIFKLSKILRALPDQQTLKEMQSSDKSLVTLIENLNKAVPFVDANKPFEAFRKQLDDLAKNQANLDTTKIDYGNLPQNGTTESPFRSPKDQFEKALATAKTSLKSLQELDSQLQVEKMGPTDEAISTKIKNLEQRLANPTLIDLQRKFLDIEKNERTLASELNQGLINEAAKARHKKEIADINEALEKDPKNPGKYAQLKNNSDDRYAKEMEDNLKAQANTPENTTKYNELLRVAKEREAIEISMLKLLNGADNLGETKDPGPKDLQELKKMIDTRKNIFKVRFLSLQRRLDSFSSLVGHGKASKMTLFEQAAKLLEISQDLKKSYPKLDLSKLDSLITRVNAASITDSDLQAIADSVNDLKPALEKTLETYKSDLVAFNPTFVKAEFDTLKRTLKLPEDKTLPQKRISRGSISSLATLLESPAEINKEVLTGEEPREPSVDEKSPVKEMATSIGAFEDAIGVTPNANHEAVTNRNINLYEQPGFIQRMWYQLVDHLVVRANPFAVVAPEYLAEGGSEFKPGRFVIRLAADSNSCVADNIRTVQADIDDMQNDEAKLAPIKDFVRMYLDSIPAD